MAYEIAVHRIHRLLDQPERGCDQPQADPVQVAIDGQGLRDRGDRFLGRLHGWQVVVDGGEPGPRFSLTDPVVPQHPVGREQVLAHVVLADRGPPRQKGAECFPQSFLESARGLSGGRLAEQRSHALARFERQRFFPRMFTCQQQSQPVPRA